MKRSCFFILLSILIFSTEAFSHSQVSAENKSFSITYKNMTPYPIRVTEGLFFRTVMEIGPKGEAAHSVHFLGHVNLLFSYQRQSSEIFRHIDNCPTMLLFMNVHSIEIHEDAENNIHCEMSV